MSKEISDLKRYHFYSTNKSGMIQGGQRSVYSLSDCLAAGFKVWKRQKYIFDKK
jgi:hypothetical protein